MGIGPWHIFLLVIIVLVFFGPSRLPGLGKSVGEAIRGFKKGMEGDEIDVTETARREQLKPTDQASSTQKQSQRQRDPSRNDSSDT